MGKSLIYCTMFFLAGGLFLHSCKKEEFQLDKLSDEIEIHTDLVAPLIHGSMGMEDLFVWFDSSTFVGKSDEGLIYLSFDNTLIDVFADTLDLMTDGLYSEVYIDPEVGGAPIFTGSSIGDTIHFVKSKYFGF